MASNATSGCVRLLISSGTVEVTNSAWTIVAAVLGVVLGIIFGALISYAIYRAFNQPQVIHYSVVSHQRFH